MKKVIFTPRDNEVFNLYINEAGKHKPLTRVEEAELSKEIQCGGKAADKALEKLVNANLLYGVHIAKQYMGCGVDLNDLIQEASIGLYEAAKLYDGTRGASFISFATAYVKKYIIMCIQKNGGQIRKPKDFFDVRSKYNRLSDYIYQTEGRRPTFDEFEEYSGLSHQKAVVAFSYITNVSAEFDAPVAGEDSNCTFGDMLYSDMESDATVDQKMLREQLDSICSCLSARNRGVLYDSFGLNTGYTLTNVEIADKYDIDADQVRKIRARAISFIQNHTDFSQLRKAI